MPELPHAAEGRSAYDTISNAPDELPARPLQPWSDAARLEQGKITTPGERLRRRKVARFENHLADIVVRDDDELGNPVVGGFVQLVGLGVVSIVLRAVFWLLEPLGWDDTYVESAGWLLLLAAALIIRATRKRWPTWPSWPTWLTPRMHAPATARLTALKLRRDSFASDQIPLHGDVRTDDAARMTASAHHHSETPSANTL